MVVNGKGQHKVLDVSVEDGSWRPIQSPEWNYIEDVAWLADRSGLVVLARETEAAPFQVWRVSYPDGVTRRLTNDLIEYDDLTISADSSVLIVRQDMGNMHLWLEPLDASAEARQLTFGTAAFDGYYGIDFLADGRIVYTSPRDGNVDLWIVDPATGKQDQLTRNAGDYNARPFVTPDGRSIVFVSSRGGSRQVWRMDSDGGNPMRLTGADSADSPVLSPDGRSVYFVQSGDDGSCLARVDIGGGEVECLLKTDSNFFPFSFSPDGKLMTLGTYDAASVQPYKLGIVSVENLSPQGTLPDRLFAPFDWTPDSTSVLAVTAEDRANLSAIPINGGKPIRLTSFSTGRIHAFAVSPDPKRLVLSRGNPSAEAVRLEGF
jgi:Tol biopolymer transport system component